MEKGSENHHGKGKATGWTYMKFSVEEKVWVAKCTADCEVVK